ncbi:MAG TPA: IS110 family transposase [Micavibrio sp.]|jgi:transposase
MTRAAQSNPTPEAASLLTLGIDISKTSLDVHILPEGKSLRFDNTEEGHRSLIAAIAKRPIKACVFEATGHYGRDLHKALHQAGLPTIQVNPRQASFFLKSHTPSHKTDKSDAAALAAMANALPLRVTPPPSPQQQALHELVSTRTQLIHDRVAASQRHQAMTATPVVNSLKALLDTLEELIAAIDAAIKDLVDGDPCLAAKARLLESVPGIGRQSAQAIMAYLPELGILSGKQIAALVGVAPKARDSGAFKGKRSIHGGRAQLRTILYMAALSAMRYNPVIKAWLAANAMHSKPHKVARIATVRKLLVILNAMAKNNTLWNY